MRRRSTREEWVELLALKEESDKSIKAFCKEFGVPEHQFYYWRKRLRQEAEAKTATGGFVKVELAEVECDGDDDSGLSLDLKRFSLRFERDFDQATLGRILAVVDPRQC